jgi:hypothetical protein
MRSAPVAYHIAPMLRPPSLLNLLREGAIQVMQTYQPSGLEQLTNKPNGIERAESSTRIIAREAAFTGQVNHIYYLNDDFTNTKGTAPQCGIDIEPNSTGDFLRDVNIHDCYTNGNAGDGPLISLQNLNSKSQPVAIYVQNHHSIGNQRYGYVGINNDPSNAPGTILIRDSFSDQSGSYGAAGRFYAANGASLTFLNLTVTNPNVNGPNPSYGDKSAVACIRGGRGTVPIGNVHFGVVLFLSVRSRLFLHHQT